MQIIGGIHAVGVGTKPCCNGKFVMNANRAGLIICKEYLEDLLW
jgi:hypothetical protein